MKKVSTWAENETRKHIMMVERLMTQCGIILIAAGMDHDKSKLEPPEKENFDVYSEKLNGVTYGSDEYKQYLAEMEPALYHHYAANFHHPEHFHDGIEGMDLFYIIEMLMDWIAASKRHADGNILQSIEINQKRFGYDDSFKRLLINTAARVLPDLGKL